MRPGALSKGGRTGGGGGRSGWGPKNCISLFNFCGAPFLSLFRFRCYTKARIRQGEKGNLQTQQKTKPPKFCFLCVFFCPRVGGVGGRGGVPSAASFCLLLRGFTYWLGRLPKITGGGQRFFEKLILFLFIPPNGRSQPGVPGYPVIDVLPTSVQRIEGGGGGGEKKSEEGEAFDKRRKGCVEAGFIVLLFVVWFFILFVMLGGRLSIVVCRIYVFQDLFVFKRRGNDVNCHKKWSFGWVL